MSERRKTGLLVGTIAAIRGTLSIGLATNFVAGTRDFRALFSRRVGPMGQAPRQIREINMRSAYTAIVLVFLIAGLSACGSKPSGGDAALQFTEAPSPSRKGEFPNWPVPPGFIDSQVKEALTLENFEVMEEEKTAQGIAGAQKVDLRFPGLDKNINFKWKEVSQGQLDVWNNSPRRELAAYKIQGLFLEPEDFVVPKSFMYCVPLVIYTETHANPSASVNDTSCVLGNFSIWLNNATFADPLYDEARFVTDPNYAYFMSNLNLLTFIVAHRDGKTSNFLISKDKDRPQVFSIDNGVSFEAYPYNFFAENWNVIRVPAVRKESIDRLRKLERKDLDILAVVAEFEKNQEGVLIAVPPGDNLDPELGVRVVGGTVQFGMTVDEIDRAWHRIQALIARVDNGDLQVF
jgi:hypothetical protein